MVRCMQHADVELSLLTFVSHGPEDALLRYTKSCFLDLQAENAMGKVTVSKKDGMTKIALNEDHSEAPARIGQAETRDRGARALPRCLCLRCLPGVCLPVLPVGYHMRS